ncbi:MAG: hypothetical protein V2A77_03280 [Pseudomonadota bacterium]
MEHKKIDREREWALSETVNNRYQEEMKRLRAQLEKEGVVLDTEEGRRRFREAVLELNRSFLVALADPPK